MKKKINDLNTEEKNNFDNIMITPWFTISDTDMFLITAQRQGFIYTYVFEGYDKRGYGIYKLKKYERYFTVDFRNNCLTGQFECFDIKDFEKHTIDGWFLNYNEDYDSLEVKYGKDEKEN